MRSLLGVLRASFAPSCLNTKAKRLHNDHKAAAVFLAATLGACGAQPQSRENEACAEPGEERIVAQMYFGRNIGGRLGVSDAEWNAFVDAEITRRFPNGLTVTDAQGQWRDSESGAIVHEPSKLLTVFLANEARDRAALQAIADVYKSQFHQQAVALVIERSCVSFE
jgi:hypothetical protein